MYKQTQLNATILTNRSTGHTQAHAQEDELATGTSQSLLVPSILNAATGPSELNKFMTGLKGMVVLRGALDSSNYRLSSLLLSILTIGSIDVERVAKLFKHNALRKERNCLSDEKGRVLFRAAQNLRFLINVKMELRGKIFDLADHTDIKRSF